MKTKKYLIAIAIIGGMLFTLQAINTYDLDGKEIAKIEKKVRKLSSAG
jgi:hypothetical protein